MPDATITSTASTFGTISGVFSADQSTISGTISGIVPGTLTGSVGVPGPAGAPGVGVPAGGTSGQFLQKTSGVDYATDWVTVNLTGLATESWVTAGFYPLTGNPSSFLTASALTPYLTSATAASTYQTLAGMSSYLTTSAAAAGYYPLSGNPSGFLTAASLSGYATESWVTSQGYITSAALTPYLTSATAASTYQTLSGMSDYLAKAGNLAGLASTSTARTNLGLGSLAVVNDAPSDGSQYARKNGAWDVVTTTPDYITSVSSPLSVTSGNLTIDLSAYAPLASPAFTGNPTAPTATFGDNDTSLATTAFVQSALAGGTAVARDLEVEVRNQSGSTIAAGSIVYISGATGNKPLITLAQANNDANSAQTIGFVKTAIANNGTGYVIVRGELENIDTSALTEGVQLYLSPTTAGTWTTTKPSAPQHLVYVGIVIRSHPTLGTILVAVQNGYELDELHDVAIGTLANNNLLAYESSTDLWKNKTYSALGLLTSADAASTYAAKTGATFTGDVLVSASPDVSTLSAGLLALVGSGSTNGMTLSTVAGYPQIYFNGPGGTSTQTVAYPGPSGFLLKADNLSGLANTGTARTNLGLGTMATATAADYSTTTAANALYYPLSSNPAGYLTSAPVTSVAGRTGAITLAVADVSGAAPLASPTFTGTPTLPTGTIGVTQTAGNNTTALATTAFVTAAVPAFASTAQVVAGTSTTTALAPSNQGFVLTNPRLQSLAFINSSALSGSGANTTTNPQNFSRQVYLSSLAIGRAAFLFGAIGTANAGFGTSTAKADQVDFSKKVWLSGYACMGWTGGTSYIGDANTMCRISLGGYSTQTTGNMTLKGIGLKKVGGVASTVSLTVHNGTTLTDVASSVTVPDGGGIHWQIYSDGTGNVTLYINGTQAATTTAGPTTATASGSACYREQVEAAATPGVRQAMNCNGGWFYTE
jgi:hypothetical protein